MTLEQLRIFVEVAERGHVTRAAEALDMSQSAASAAIAALESAYQIKLFDRVGRGIQLTETGRTFLREARAVLDRASMARAVLQDLAGGPAGPSDDRDLLAAPAACSLPGRESPGASQCGDPQYP
jgi:DNA-binding transcriptional LysR family regulator